MKTQSKIGAVSLLLIALLAFCNCPSFADETVEDLEKQIKALQERVDELEGNQSKQQNDPWGHFNQRHSQGWDPFDEMHRMQEEMDRMFQNSFRHQGNAGSGIFSNSLSFGADFDLTETDDGYEITFDMAGLDKDQIDIQINEHSITVKGEQSNQQQQDNPNGFFHSQSFGTFMKTIPLPVDADTSKVKTEKKKDKLLIQLPKKS